MAIPASARFTGTVAVVTGAAAGIGAACARRLAAEGAAVVIADIDDPASRSLAEQLADGGGRARFVPCDVADADAWKQVHRTALDAYGRVDVLVSNAHAFTAAPVAELSPAGWQRTLDVCLTALFHGVKTLAEPLTQARGAVVAVSSVHALASMPHFSAYAAAKGGLCALVRQLAVEYGPALRVNAVLPGPVRTRQWRHAPTELLEQEADRTVLGRFADPGEVAAAVAFLASPEASFITGASLTVDGGWSVRHR